MFFLDFLGITRVHFHDVQILTRYPNIETPETPRIFHTFSCFLFISVARPKHFSHETQSRQPAVDAPPASVMAPPRLYFRHGLHASYPPVRGRYRWLIIIVFLACTGHLGRFHASSMSVRPVAVSVEVWPSCGCGPAVFRAF